MKKIFKYIVVAIFVSIFLSSCSNPQKVDVQLEEKKVVKTRTNYTASLDVFGKMTEIYATKPAKIQSKGIVDDTGAAQATGGEIPIDITEMIKTAINKMGGKIQYIDYDPAHMSNMKALGYSNFKNKIIPTLVISGGITEFDRSLDVRGKGSDLGAEGTVGGKSIGLDMGDNEKKSKSNITIDLSLIDFQTWAMVPKMSATNTVSVNSGIASSEIGFSILAVSFGLSGNVKKVQGRHAAVRLLVELSTIEVVGRYLDLPYWKILPNGIVDKVVIESISKKFVRSSAQDRVAMIQNALYLHGYTADMTGKVDEATKASIDKYKAKEGSSVPGYDTLELFQELYVNVPIDNNYRSANVFYTPSVIKAVQAQKNKVKQQKSQQQKAVKQVEKQPSKKVLATSKPVAAVESVAKSSTKAIPKARNLTAKGIFLNKNETLAINMATNMAINSLAKKLGRVVQSEYSNFMNDDVMMRITTNAKNIVSGYEILSEKYDYKTGKAIVMIQLDGEVIDAEIKNNLK